MYRSHTRQRVALATLVAACVTVITLDFRQNEGGPVRRLQTGASSVVAPLQEGVSKAFRSIGGVFSGIGEIGSLREDKARLERELETARAAQVQFPELVREHEELLALMKEQPWNRGRVADASVISQGFSNREHVVMIDKGSDAGIAEGMAVVGSQGLIGRVVLVAGDHAKILLLIDPRHSVGARLTGSREVGVLHGRGRDDPRFDLIDPTIEVKHGEEVVTSGFDGGIYPAGIPIGRVEKSQQARDGLTQSATVKPFTDFTRLQFVRVLLDTGAVVEGEDVGG